MKYVLQLFIEAIIIGIITVIVGNIIVAVISFSNIYPRPKLPEICMNYNKYFIMEISLFLTGAFIHLFCEFAGINAWYLKNGAILKRLNG